MISVGSANSGGWGRDHRAVIEATGNLPGILVPPSVSFQ
jgi:hypothetical protein